MKRKRKVDKLSLFMAFVLLFSLATASLVMAQTVDLEAPMDAVETQVEGSLLDRATVEETQEVEAKPNQAETEEVLIEEPKAEEEKPAVEESMDKEPIPEESHPVTEEERTESEPVIEEDVVTSDEADDAEKSLNKADVVEEIQRDDIIAPMAIINPGPGDYDVADNNLILDVLGTSTNEHTYATMAWYDENGNFYMAVQSTHVLGGTMYIHLGQNTINSDDTHIYDILENITVEEQDYAPTTHVSGNTKDARWTVYKFEDANITAGNYTFDVTGIGGGHDITGRPLTISVPKIDINITKVWDGGEGSRPDVNLQLYIGENAVDGTRVTLIAPKTTHTWTDMDGTDGRGVRLDYRVKEDPISGYDTVVTGNAMEGFIVTNTFVPKVDVTIEKFITGNYGEVTKAFPFRVIVNGDEGNAIGFNLSHGGTKLLSDLPSNAVLTLTEESGNYTVTVKVGETVINPNPDGSYTYALDGEDVTITFTNHKDVSIDTGITLDFLPYVLILGFVIASFTVMVIRRRNSHS